MDSAVAAAACVSRRDSNKRLTATASRTFVSSSAASGRPRSAKTLPELAATLFTLLACLAIPRLVICLRRPWASLNHFTLHEMWRSDNRSPKPADRQRPLHRQSRTSKRTHFHGRVNTSSRATNRPLTETSVYLDSLGHPSVTAQDVSL